MQQLYFSQYSIISKQYNHYNNDYIALIISTNLLLIFKFEKLIKKIYFYFESFEKKL